MAKFFTDILDGIGRNARGIATIRNSFDPPSSASQHRRITPEELAPAANDSDAGNPLLAVGLVAAVAVGALLLLKK